MPKNRLLLALVVGCSLLVVGCKEGVPKDVIQPNHMEGLLYDYHISRAMIKDLPKAEQYKQASYIKYVLNKHGVTQEEFDSSMVWYARHTEELNKIYDNLKVRMHKEQDQINHLISIRDNKPKESAPGDSVDIWVGNRLYALTGSPILNKVVFDIPIDKHFEERDWFVWKLRYTFTPLFLNVSDTAFLSLYAKYTNDSLVYVNRLLTQSGVDSLTLRCDSTYRLMQLKGYIYYQGKRLDKGMLIDNIRLMRYRYVASDTLQIKKETGKQTVGDTFEEPVEPGSKQLPQVQIINKRVMENAEIGAKRSRRGQFSKSISNETLRSTSVA